MKWACSTPRDPVFLGVTGTSVTSLCLLYLIPYWLYMGQKTIFPIPPAKIFFSLFCNELIFTPHAHCLYLFSQICIYCILFDVNFPLFSFVLVLYIYPLSLFPFLIFLIFLLKWHWLISGGGGGRLFSNMYVPFYRCRNLNVIFFNLSQTWLSNNANFSFKYKLQLHEKKLTRLCSFFTIVHNYTSGQNSRT